MNHSELTPYVAAHSYFLLAFETGSHQNPQFISIRYYVGPCLQITAQASEDSNNLVAIILTVVATAVVLFIAGIGWFQYMKVGQESDEVGGIDVTGHACH